MEVGMRRVPQDASTVGPEVATCVCFNVRKAARAVTQLYDAVLRPSGLRVTQFSILAVLARSGPLTQSRLARATVTDRTTLTRNLRPLVARGLIRVARGEDGREREIGLTEPGRRALAKAYPLWKEAQGRMAKQFERGPRASKVGSLLADLGALVAVTRG
jgi:DNA-binding MarR family transcriptional regulator